MKLIFKKTLFFFLVISILTVGFYSNNSYVNDSRESYNNNVVIIEELQISDYWDENDVDFIHIYNDNWSASGDPWIKDDLGTFDHPHIIENVTINGQNPRPCILIEDCSDYFIIRNCTLYNSGASSFGWSADVAGIVLKNTNNGRLIGNNCSLNNDGSGIYLHNSDNNILINNTANNNYYYGIYLFSSENNKIQNNTANSNCGMGEDSAGLYLQGAINNTIHNNTFNLNVNGILGEEATKNNTISENIINSNTHYGIDIYSSSHNNTIFKNTIESNGKSGIYIYNSKHITIRENKLINCGLQILPGFAGLDSIFPIIIDGSNSVNNKLIYLYANKTGLQLENLPNVGQIILINCTDSNITDMNISHGSIGISMIYCNNYSISNNTLNFNNEFGIRISFSNNSYINNNTLNYNECGIRIGEFCNNHTIIENLANHNEKYGIDLITYGSEVNSYNTLSNNKLTGCGFRFLGLLDSLSSVSFDSTNKVNEKEVYYYINEVGLEPEDFSDAGQIILINCNNSLIAMIHLMLFIFILLTTLQ